MFGKLKSFFVVTLVMFISASAEAHHPSGGAGLGKMGPVRTISASTFERGKWALALQTEFIKLDDYSDGELITIAEGGNHVHSVESIFHTNLSMGYGITDDLTLSLKVPYVILNNIKEAHEEEPDDIHIRGDAKGIGDLTILSQYRFIKKYDIEMESSLIFGLKMPAGYTKAKDVNGERLETEFQPGSGSLNPLAGISVTKRFKKMSLDADILYTVATKGAQETDLGDLFNYDISLSYAVVSMPIVWDLILEANGEWKQKQKIEGVADDDSGGTVIFLSPGMRFSWGKTASVYLSAGFPITQDLNGNQNETSIRTLIGFSMGL